MFKTIKYILTLVGLAFLVDRLMGLYSEPHTRRY